MTRTENDLRAAYTDSPDIQAAECRLIDSMSAANLAVHRTRARRRRTWVATGASAALVVAMAVSVAVMAPNRSGGSTSQPAGAAVDSTAASAPAQSHSAPAQSHSAPAPSHSAARPDPVIARVTITPQVLLRTAVDLLPRRGTTGHYGGNFGAGFVGARFVYDDGHGAAQIYVSMTYPTAGMSVKDVGSTGPCAAGSSGCTVLPDGAHVQVRQGHEYSDGRTPNAAVWYLDLVRPDGVQIGFIEWNAPQPKGAAITRPRPPFTIAELTEWADSPSWQVQITAQQASAAAGMFHADNIDAPPRDAASAKQLQQQRTANCQLAKKIGKPAPPYCDQQH